MLDKWLGWKERNPCPYSEFEVIDVEQINDLSQEVKLHLADLLLAARIDPTYLREVTEVLETAKEVKDFITRKIPTGTNAKRGEFGEMLICAILEQFHGYKIPVQKLRFKITKGESLPGTDILALKTNIEGLITEVCFIESKLRTSSDNRAAIEGCNQLQGDYNSKFPDMVDFVTQRLYERQDPLFRPFLLYMRDRSDSTDKDTFRLSLCLEHSVSDEKVLVNLQDHGVDLPGLTVHMMPIPDLRQITDELFAKIGVVEISDED